MLHPVVSDSFYILGNIFELVLHQERLWDNERVKLVVQEIPVDYEFVQQNVPRLWTGEDESDGNGVLALIHVGVSGIARKITIETKVGHFSYNKLKRKCTAALYYLSQAHNSGYLRKDVNGKCPDDGK